MEIGQQLLDRLRSVHRAGYVHGDIKPGNVLEGERGTYYLVDFGMSSEYLVGT